MAWRMSTTFIAAALTSIHAQTELDRTWEAELAQNHTPYHQLTLKDFRIDDKAHPEADYTVKTFLDPQYHYLQHIADDGTAHVYVTDWSIFSGLDKNDTVRKSGVRDMPERLPYAQALLDLSELRARELAALRPTQLPSAQGGSIEAARAALDEKIKVLCADKFAQAHAEMQEFEKATRKGTDRKKVRELAGGIRKRLDALPPVPGPSPAPSLH